MESAIHIDKSILYHHIAALSKLYQSYRADNPQWQRDELLCMPDNTIDCELPNYDFLKEYVLISRVMKSPITLPVSSSVGHPLNVNILWSGNSDTVLVGAVEPIWGFAVSSVAPIIRNFEQHTVSTLNASEWASVEHISEEYALEEHVLLSTEEIDEFCRSHDLSKELDIYIAAARRIYDNAELSLSLSEDPEIENYTKIALNIKIKEDIDVVLRKDREFFDAIEETLPEDKQEYFVKTYEIIE